MGAATVALVVACLIGVQGLGSMACLWLPAIAPEVAGDLGVPAALIGYQVTIVYCGAILLSLSAGGFIARFGAWRTSQLSLLLFALGQGLLALGRPWPIALGSVVMGFGYALINPAAAHLLDRIASPRNRNLIFSLRFTGVPLGGVAASLAAPRLALLVGWEASTLAVIAAALLLALAMQRPRGRWDDDRDGAARLFRPPGDGIRLAWRLPPVRWLCFVGMILAGIQLSLSAFAVTLLVEDLAWPLIAAAYGLLVVQIAGAVGRVFWGAVADRAGSGMAVLLLIAVLTAGCATLAALLAPGWPGWAVYGLFFLFGLSAVGWNGVYAAEVARLSPAGTVGSMVGATMAFLFAGIIAGPFLFTTALALTGRYATTFGATAGLAVLAAAMVALAWRRAARQSDDAPPGP